MFAADTVAKVEIPDDLMLPVTSPVTPPVKLPVTLPTNPEVAVTIPEALMFAADTVAKVEIPDDLMLPVTLPVKPPTNPLVAVTIPEALTLVNEMSLSRLTVKVLLFAEEFKFVPPETVKVSFNKLIVSVPKSEVTVKAVATFTVDAEVKRPLASTVNVGISEADP